MLALTRPINAVTVSIIAKSIVRPAGTERLPPCTVKRIRLANRQSEPGGDFAQHLCLPENSQANAVDYNPCLKPNLRKSTGRRDNH
jgi:hypothetical protein